MTRKATEAEKKAYALARLNRACALIERAQNDLASACGELSALNGGIPTWTACHKLTDRVKSFWYRVDNFRKVGRWSLDETNVQALERRLAELEAAQGCAAQS